MQRSLSIPVATALLLLLSVRAHPADELVLKARVSAGESTRIDTPVSLVVEIPQKLRAAMEEDVPIPAMVAAVGKRPEATAEFQPAQAEPLEGPEVRIWWIVKHLGAGESQQYQVHLWPSLKGETEDDRGVFSWKDSSAEGLRSTDLLLGKAPVLRYMWTPFDEENIELTKKPFHHVFDPDGSRLITKGAGGRYPHHRGIFFGYNRCRVNGPSYDTWHAARGEHTVHREVLRTTTGPVVGGHTVRIDWNDREGKPFATETRRLRVFRQSKGHTLIEVTTRLAAAAGSVRLEGDRQHAGLQFRASQYVADHAGDTLYLRPEKWAELPPKSEHNAKDYRDLPWNALQFKIEDRSYTVAYLSDPSNPDGADFSERRYGRFGEYIPWDLGPDSPLSLRYRIWVDATGEVTREDVVRRYADLAEPPEVTRVR